MNFKEKLYELRRLKGLSQEEIGEKINVSRQTISKWENGQTTPELEKLIELSKIFDIPIDELIGNDINNEKQDIPPKLNKKKLCLKILIIFVLIYLFISIYKIIGLTRFYLVANSFNEENYWMTECINIFSKSENGKSNYSVIKIGNKIKLSTSSNNTDIPYDIEEINLDEKTATIYHYDYDTGTYTSENRLDDFTSEQEIEEFFNKYSQNYIKEDTLSLIPSDAKSILLNSLNPFFNISLIKNEIRYNYVWDKTKIKICLSHDCLVKRYYLKNECENYEEIIDFNYDYVQEHFNDKKI